MSRRAAVALTTCLAAVGAAAALLIPYRKAPADPAPAAPAARQTSLALSKEYIYAGGRLVATEEPTPAAPAGPPPAALTAVAAAGTSAGVPVNITWQTSAGASHYEVERGAWDPQRNSVVFTPLVADVTGPTYSDGGAAPGHAYLYRARAVFPVGGRSDYSNVDLATAVPFTQPAPSAGGLIRAAHFNELRSAVQAVRALAGLGAAAWTYPDPVAGPPSQRRKIYLEDVTELRSALDEALAVLGLRRPYPPDPPLARGAAVSAAHFEQIRERVR